ncbi:hypothetical protein AOLI_G00274880 [Acnodon oligacanthus]
MGCASVLDLLLLSAGLLSVTGGPQTLPTLVAEPGDDVTIWSNQTLEEPAHIFWFKHTNASVPDLLTCLYYKLYSSPKPSSSSSDLFFMLTVVFSAVIVILLGALIIILKGRKQCGDGSADTILSEFIALK